LLSFLALNDFSCIVFNPLIVKDSPSISLRKTKTDKIDARSIACTLFYLQHQLPSSPFLNPEFRDIVRERESAKAIQNAPIDALNAFFSKSAGRKPKLSVAFLKELASNSIAQYWPMKEMLLVQNITRLRLFQQQLEECDSKLTQYCECSSNNADIELLTSIKGIGQNSAMHFLAEARFQGSVPTKSSLHIVDLIQTLHNQAKAK